MFWNWFPVSMVTILRLFLSTNVFLFFGKKNHIVIVTFYSWQLIIAVIFFISIKITNLKDCHFLSFVSVTMATVALSKKNRGILLFFYINMCQCYIIKKWLLPLYKIWVLHSCRIDLLRRVLNDNKRFFFLFLSDCSRYHVIWMQQIYFYMALPAMHRYLYLPRACWKGHSL